MHSLTQGTVRHGPVFPVVPRGYRRIRSGLRERVHQGHVTCTCGRARTRLIAPLVHPQYSGVMSKRRNRHGRGQRGPVVLPRVYGGRIDRIDPTDAEFFTACLAEAVRQVQRSCPGILDNVIVGAEDVPAMPGWTEERVPLSSAVDGSDDSPARVVIYRRPLELRTASRRGLAILVHRTLVEQLSALTGLPVEKSDPDIDE